jgi:hypothetical protein
LKFIISSRITSGILERKIAKALKGDDLFHQCSRSQGPEKIELLENYDVEISI